MTVADPRGTEVIRRERIDISDRVTYFRKVWDNGFVDLYERSEGPTGTTRTPITEETWLAGSRGREVVGE